MRTVQRQRRYISPHLIAFARPLLRYSEVRDAYVLRLIGRNRGPVLKAERRRRDSWFDGAAERRGVRHA